MSAPTAAGLLKMLDRRKTQVAVAALGDLDDAGHDAVRRALTAVPAGSRIDVPGLLESVRAQLRRRAEAEAEKRSAAAQPWRYELLLKNPRELLRLRDHLKAAADAGETMVEWPPGSAHALLDERLGEIRARLRPGADPEDDLLDDDLDDEDLDDEPARPIRRGVRRLRSRSVEDGAAALAGAGHPPAAAGARHAGPPGRHGRLLGGRVFVDGEDVTPEPVDHFRPPWLIDGGAPEEPDPDEDRDAA